MVLYEPIAFATTTTTEVLMLDRVERRALGMIYVDGLTQQQVAERLGRQRRDVAAIVARAMRTVALAVLKGVQPTFIETRDDSGAVTG